MSYPINYPTPQGANIQIFHAAPTGQYDQRWVKPQGASFVWFTLIGAGGGGDNGTGTGGGSGAVTNFMGPAFLIPDNLSVTAGKGGSVGNNGDASIVFYTGKTSYQLLNANGGVPGGGGSASTSNYFSAMGFFQSVAGAPGANTSVPASSTTFLSGGGPSSVSVTSNYGYALPTSSAANGFFQMQPIMVGTGGIFSGIGGIGCGGGSNGAGGDGMVVIITW